MVPILPIRHRQRGAVGLVAALFLILVVLIMGQVTLRLAATGANDSLLTHDGVAALLLAETGLERAAGQLAAATATCDASLVGSWAYAGGSIDIADLGAGFNTDFDGSALASGRCRVRASGSTGLFSAQRTVEAIIDTQGNLLGSANANFDLPGGACTGPCTPTGWELEPGEWDDTGGPDGSRAAYVNKPIPGGLRVTSAGQYALTPFTITAPATLTMDFDYRYLCDQNQDFIIEMSLHSGGTTYIGSGFITDQPATGFQSAAITFTVPGSGPVTIDGFEFELTARPGRPKQAWLDNLFLSGGGAGAASMLRWREIIN